LNTNIITKYIIKTKRFVTTLLLLFALSLNFSCIDSAEEFQVVTDNPFGVGIIVFSSIPAQIFGNGCEIDTVKVNTGLIADGSTIEVEVTNTGSLDGNAGGCITGSAATIINGMATFDFLSPIFIGNQGEIDSVNVAIRITTPDGTTINDFFTALINAVGITAPDDFDTTPNDTLAPTSLFFNLEFLTFGLKPGSEVMCEVSNEDLGSVTSITVVLGSVESGSFNVEYVLTNGSIGGIQVLTCMVELPNPSSFGPQCASVPLADRKINAEVIITQGAAGDIANPPPDPAPTSMVCNPSTIQEGNSGTCTCVNSDAAGAEICFIGDDEVTFPFSCAAADVNGVAVVGYDTSAVDADGINIVTCGPSGGDSILDPGDPFAQTTVTVTEEAPVIATNLSCTPNPAIDGDDVVCTCTSNVEPGGELCFVVASGTSFSFPAPTDNCVEADGSGTGVVIATAGTTVVPENNILECCANSNDDSDCNEEDVAQLVELVNPIPIGQITVSVVSIPDLLPPLAQSILTGTITGLPTLTPGCFDIFINSSGAGPATDPLINGGSGPVCGTTDVNGVINAVYTAGSIDGVDTIIFCHDVGAGGSCGAGETSALEQITVQAPAPPPPPTVVCTSNPSPIMPGNNSAISAVFANLPTGFDEACWNISGDTIPSSEPLVPVCAPIVGAGAFTVFTADSNIASQQNAIIACCADMATNTNGCFDGEGEIVSPQPAVVVVDPAMVQPFVITLSTFPDNMPVGAATTRPVNVLINPVPPDDTEVCMEIIVDSMDTIGTATIESLDDAATNAGTVCDQTAGGTGVMTSVFTFTNSDSPDMGDFATVRGWIDLNQNATLDVGEAFNDLSYVIP